jgi:hypothetical protein
VKILHLPQLFDRVGLEVGVDDLVVVGAQQDEVVEFVPLVFALARVVARGAWPCTFDVADLAL